MATRLVIIIREDDVLEEIREDSCDGDGHWNREKANVGGEVAVDDVQVCVEDHVEDIHIAGATDETDEERVGEEEPDIVRCDEVDLGRKER